MRVAVIGVGYMGLRHAYRYQTISGVDIAAIADIDPSTESVAKKLGCDWFNSVEELLDSGLVVDAVSIASPTHTHFSVASRLLASGVHCLVEKPLAADSLEARRLVQVAQESGALLLPGHIERFNPAVRAVVNQSPKVRYLSAYRVGPMSFRSTSTDVVLDVMIHDIDLAVYLMGSAGCSVEIVRTISSPEGVNDLTSTRLLFGNEREAELTASRLAIARRRKLRMITEEGYISLDCGEGRAMQLDRRSYYAGLKELKEFQALGGEPSSEQIFRAVGAKSLVTKGGEFDSDALETQLDHFLKMTRGQISESEAVISAEDGLVALRIAEEILSSSEPHNKVTPSDSFRSSSAQVNEEFFS